MSGYKSYATKVNGIIKVTEPYLPAKVSSLIDINRFMIEFIESIGNQPSHKMTEEAVMKNAAQCQTHFSKYMDYIRKHPDSKYVPKPKKKK